MASCQTNEVGRYQYMEGTLQIIDTKEGILYSPPHRDDGYRYNIVTNKREVWVEGAWKTEAKEKGEKRKILIGRDHKGDPIYKNTESEEAKPAAEAKKKKLFPVGEAI